jgi:hypothetical protein
MEGKLLKVAKMDEIPTNYGKEFTPIAKVIEMLVEKEHKRNKEEK